MVLQLCLAIVIAVTVSALCSILEAALYSVPGSHLEVLQEKGLKAGHTLQDLKSNISRPIIAILTLNTVANTMGAAVAGASAAAVFGDAYLGWFSAAFTLAILMFSEILPKTIGVAYSRALAPWIATPLKILVKLLAPAIWFCQLLTRLMPHPAEEGLASPEEVRAIAALGLRSGSIDPQEEKVIANILELKNKSVIDAMTPRPVTFILDGSLTVGEAKEHHENWDHHSRVPVYRKSPDNVTGIVLRKDLMLAVMMARNAASLESLARPVHFVPETAPLSRVLLDFFEKHQHLFVVVDEYGSFTGVISLEDVIEEIMGREIMDESDQIRDMRALAKSRRKERARKETPSSRNTPEEAP